MGRVAILGGGGVGVCAALELADAGFHVDIFERRNQLVRGASRVNEGKIHQGFIYAKDDPDLTARLMAIGALSFVSNLGRWIDVGNALFTSTPFIYAVHNDSLMSVEALKAHFECCRNIFKATQAGQERSYLDRGEAIDYREMSADELADILDPDAFKTAFETTECAVDPRPIAEALATAASECARISVLHGATARGVERRRDNRFKVHYAIDGETMTDGPFDAVINATWEGRLEIDRSLGLTPRRSWSYRHKFGNRVLVSLKPTDLPSVTSVLGPFGDIVNFGDNGFYLSWYPTGMVSMTRDLAPPPEWDKLDRAQRLEVFYRSLAQWQRLCPKLRTLEFGEDAIDPVSGMIFAWGDTDIDQENSYLHTRHEIGVESFEGYHSVNTGKFTMMPLIGLEAANRVLGRACALGAP